MDGPAGAFAEGQAIGERVEREMAEAMGTRVTFAGDWMPPPPLVARRRFSPAEVELRARLPLSPVLTGAPDARQVVRYLRAALPRKRWPAR